MKYTNNFSYSKFIATILMISEYREKVPGELSATDFYKGIREIILHERYDKMLEKDVSENIQQQIGQALHYFAKNTVSYPGLVHGEPIKVEIGGLIVSGEPDNFDRVENLSPNLKYLLQPDWNDWYVCFDLKTTKVWNVRKKINYREWNIQLQVYKFLLDLQKKYKMVPFGIIAAWMKDWSAKDKGEFPTAISEIPFGLEMDSKEILDEIISPKLSDYNKYRDALDEDLPLCCEVERWNNDLKCRHYCEVRKICEWGAQYS
jgi:hypothetical protein